MSKNLSLFTLLLLSCFSVQSQSTWENFYIHQQTDAGYAVEPTSDGKYIVCGSTRTAGANFDDILLMLIDSTGAVSWAKSFSTPLSDQAYDVKQTADGGFIIAGSSNGTSAGAKNAILIKTNATGDLTWAKVFGNALADEFFAVAELPGGGYVATGSSFDPGNLGIKTEVFAVKVNSSGVAQWEKVMGGVGDDEGRDLIITPTGAALIVGTREGGGTGLDVYMTELDVTTGNANWISMLRGANEEKVYRIIKDGNSGNYILAGSTKSLNAAGKAQALLQTITPTGLPSGNKIFFEPGADVSAMSVVKTASGNYAMIGSLSGIVEQAIHLELDSTKEILHSNTLTGFEAKDIAVGLNGKYIGVARFQKPASTNPALYLSSLNFTNGFPSPCPGSLSLSDTSGVLTVFTPTDTNSSYTSTYTVTLTVNSFSSTVKNGCDPTSIDGDKELNNLTLFPNPSSGSFTLLWNADLALTEVTISDMNGKLMTKELINNRTGEMRIENNGLAPGIYLVKTTFEGGKTNTHKLLVY